MGIGSALSFYGSSATFSSSVPLLPDSALLFLAHRGLLLVRPNFSVLARLFMAHRRLFLLGSDLLWLGDLQGDFCSLGDDFSWLLGDYFWLGADFFWLGGDFLWFGAFLSWLIGEFLKGACFLKLMAHR